jgi:O-acetyl-ADP-ribose deacetylase
LPTGEAVMTTGGSLPARHVIHTVGPVYGRHSGAEADLLAACYTNSLQLAIDNSLNAIAFPAISTGVFGYPTSEAAAVSSQAIELVLENSETLSEVRLVFFRPHDAETFLNHHRFS